MNSDPERDLANGVYFPARTEAVAKMSTQACHSEGKLVSMVEAPKDKPPVTSGGKWWGWNNRIWGVHGDHETIYMRRFWLGRLRLHIFHRGDQDDDCHDHPWGFWTFPLTSYVEEVVVEDRVKDQMPGVPSVYRRRRLQVVPAFRLTFRPATHTHRVLGRYAGFARVKGLAATFPYAATIVNRVIGCEPIITRGPIVTIVWRTGDQRNWGFLKERNGRWCWVAWREYVFGGGKDSACS